MKNLSEYLKTAALIAAVSLLTLSCNNNSTGSGKADVPPDPPKYAPFAEGADVSWLTEMEAMGIKFHNAAGEERDGMTLMKEIGFDAIRLRVWVDPDPQYSTWCGKEDFLAKARRVHALGLRLMVDFHYSDRWADPSNQFKPRAWAGYSTGELYTAIKEHTIDILEALKKEGITPEWVQVGNETSDGMLWEDGRASSNMQTYATMTQVGYNAVKEVFPTAKVIVHLDHGDDAALYQWIFKGLDDNGAKWNIIGMSLYPEYYVADGKYDDGDYKEVVDKAIDNATALFSLYGTPVMFCEVGMTWNKPEESYKYMSYLMERCKAMPHGACAGIFYWEPQVNPTWKPESYESLGWGSYDKGAFDENFAPTKALDIFKD